MRTLRQRTVSGLWWNAITLSLNKALQFATTVTLARLLSPREFGLIGMIVVITGFASSIMDAGLRASLVQKQNLSNRHLDTVFWLNVSFGGALTVIFGLSSPLLAKFYDEPSLCPLAVALAFNFLIGSVNVVQYGLLQKVLDFRKLFWVNIGATVGSTIFAILLALAGTGVWSLVGQSLCDNLIRTAQIWRFSSWKPKRRFQLSAVKSLLSFGSYVVGFNVVVYCAQNFDKLIIGRQMGTSALGTYGLSDRLMRLPLTSVTDPFGAVIFPALSEIQKDLELMRRVYLQANCTIVLFTFPMMLGLCVLAEPAILVIYGSQWRDAVAIVQLLCLAGLAQSVYNTGGWIFLSLGRTDILFWLGVFSMLVRVSGVLVGMHWGLSGIAWAYVVGGYAFLLYPTCSLAGGLIGLRFGDLLKSVAPTFFCALCMAAIVWLSYHWILQDRSQWIRLLANLVVGTTAYWFLVTRLRLAAWLNVRELIFEKLKLLRSEGV
jgi:PST family polysaccharide transporter